MKENKELKNKIENVFANESDWETIKELSNETFVEQQMKKQWDATDNFSDDSEVGQRIWRNVLFGEAIPQRKTRPIRKAMLAVAAVAATLFVGVGGYLFGTQEDTTKVETFVEIHSGGNMMYQLPDSSKVWMKPGSSIRFAENFAENRQVWSKGESVFDVKKDIANSFKVHVDKANIEVLGTTFRVKELVGKGSEIILYEGKVQFNRDDARQSLIMTPNQKLTYNSLDGSLQLVQATGVEWEDGKYTFSNIRIDALIKMVNSLYNVHIVLGDNVSPSQQIAGTIRYDESLEDVIYKMCYSLKAQHTERDNRIIINR